MKILYQRNPFTPKDLKKQINRNLMTFDVVFDEKDHGCLDQQNISRLLKFYKVCIDEADQKKLEKVKGRIQFYMNTIITFELSFLATISLIKYRIPNIRIILLFTGHSDLKFAPKVFWQFIQFKNYIPAKIIHI